VPITKLLSKQLTTVLSDFLSTTAKYKTPLIRISWEGEPSGYAENPDNWILL